MSIRIPADYLTLPELRERWKLPADSLDVHRAVLKGILRPSLFMSGELAMAVPGGPLQAGERALVHGFVYAQCLRQTGAFDCEVSAVSYARDPADDGALFLLDTPLTMADLFTHAVVMAEDVEAAEQQLAASGQDLSTKELNSALKLLVIAAANGYGFTPGVRSPIPAEMCAAGASLGIDISENTVRKVLRQAFDQFGPQQAPQLNCSPQDSIEAHAVRAVR